MTGLIYALYNITKDGNAVFYVGATRRPHDKRLKEHLTDFSDSPKAKWIQNCIFSDIPVRMLVLQVLPDATDKELISYEKKWIADYKQQHRLYNSSCGGEGLKRKLYDTYEVECPICTTLFMPREGFATYCSSECQLYVRRITKVVRPKRRDNLFLGKYCAYDCSCEFCLKVEKMNHKRPYVNPRRLIFVEGSSHVFGD